MVVIIDGKIVHETVTSAADIAVIGPCMAGHAADTCSLFDRLRFAHRLDQRGSQQKLPRAHRIAGDLP